MKNGYWKWSRIEEKFQVKIKNFYKKLKSNKTSLNIMEIHWEEKEEGNRCLKRSCCREKIEEICLHVHKRQKKIKQN